MKSTNKNDRKILEEILAFEEKVVNAPHKNKAKLINELLVFIEETLNTRPINFKNPSRLDAIFVLFMNFQCQIKVSNYINDKYDLSENKDLIGLFIKINNVNLSMIFNTIKNILKVKGD